MKTAQGYLLKNMALAAVIVIGSYLGAEAAEVSKRAPAPVPSQVATQVDLPPEHVPLSKLYSPLLVTHAGMISCPTCSGN
jgi:hypothetical protein